MPYVPRQATTASCAHCGTSYESRHLRRKYCSNSCNVLASYERNGRTISTRPTRADLEQMLATLIKLVNPKPKPAAKAAATSAKGKTPAEVYRRGPGTNDSDKSSPEYTRKLELAKAQLKAAAALQAKSEARKK